jgi:hypothetical protein
MEDLGHWRLIDLSRSSYEIPTCSF